MAFVSQTVGWLRALLFGLGLCTASKGSRAHGTHANSDGPTRSPAHWPETPVSPAMMSAWLVLARLRRARRAAQKGQGEAHALAPACDLPPRRSQHALHTGKLRGVGQ